MKRGRLWSVGVVGLAFALVLAMIGCGDTESDAMADAEPADSAIEDVDEGMAAVMAFDDDEAQAFLTNTCAGCHIGGGMSGGIMLDDVTLLIGAPSSRAGIPLIDPGDSMNSYIWRKMADVDIAGARMPFQRTPVGPDDLAAFAGWIDGLEEAAP